jgi:hypothetical protein
VDTEYQWLSTVPNENFRGDFAIMLKNNKHTQLDISKFIETYVNKSGKYEPGKIYNIEIVQFAGGKDDDATKLSHIFEAAIFHLNQTGRFGCVTYNVPPGVVVPSIEGVSDSKPLSATIVRECARKCFHDARGTPDPITAGIRCWQTEFPFFVTGEEFSIRSLYTEIITDPTGSIYPIKKSVKSTKPKSVRVQPYKAAGQGGSRRKIKKLRLSTHPTTFKPTITISSRTNSKIDGMSSTDSNKYGQETLSEMMFGERCFRTLNLEKSFES